MQFNWLKAIGKFLLGVLAAVVAFVANNPSIITDLIPDKIASLTIAGLVVEIIDYLHNRLTKQ